MASFGGVIVNLTRIVTARLDAMMRRRSVFSASYSIGHPPHSSASPVELRLQVVIGPRALLYLRKDYLKCVVVRRPSSVVVVVVVVVRLYLLSSHVY